MKYALLILTFFLSACSIKNYTHEKSKIIIIKSPKIKFADIGFVRNSDKAIELELFIAGNAVQKISINHLVCTNEGCMSKSGFNEDYLSKYYPDEILQNVILGNPIYNGKNKIKTQDGFEQNIDGEDVDISYRVNTKEIYFKDKTNKILFKIKDTIK